MSAVILAVIVIMWAVVLVPMWLRRHDAATESRSADKFSAAMRVLSRRQPSSGSARYVLMPRRESAASVHVSGAAAPRRAAPAAPRRKASLAVRRRRLLLGLVGVAVLTMVLAVAGVMGWVLQFVVDLIVVGFVVHLRVQARRSAAVARARRRAASRVPVTAADAPVTPTAARYAARMAAPVAAELEFVEAPEVLAEEIAVEATGTDDGSAWEPVPVPRPTYTMKPPAPPRRYPPVQPDSDYVGADTGDEVVAADAEVVAADDEGQLDEILTHRWAVND
ncbi:MAG: hypothetical protein QOC82_1459 [Frankiaceae bacterium]|nr:hypothetical protein [Frankiaceae bacterium]